MSWPIKPLGEVATLQRGFDLPTQNRLDGSTPIYAANGPVGFHNEARVAGPGVVTGRSGSIGKVHYVQGGYWPLNTALYVKNFHGNDPKYIYWLLRELRLERFHHGTGVPTLNRNVVHLERVPVPPLSEQRRIAAILDKADALHAKRREAIAKLDQLLQSVFLEMFGDPTGNPKGWPIASLAEVVNKGAVVTYGIVQAGEEFPGGVPYIRTGDIVDGQIAESDLRHTNPAIADKFSRSRVDAGDIVMSIRATVGTTAVVPDSLAGANLTQGTARIAVGEVVDRHFALHHIRSLGTQRWIEQQVKGATFREITLGRLRELPMLLPPRELQDQFGRICHQINMGGALATAALSGAVELFATLQQQAFAGKL